MSSIEWSFHHYATFRAALAFLLQRNGWAGKYYSITSLMDTMNTICGYTDANNDMKKTMKRVDEEMIKAALQVEGVTKKDDGGKVFSC
jgi:hypothetical protein